MNGPLQDLLDTPAPTAVAASAAFADVVVMGNRECSPAWQLVALLGLPFAIALAVWAFRRYLRADWKFRVLDDTRKL